MSESDLFFSLLRVSATQILRAAGLTTAKPSVIDAFTGAPQPPRAPAAAARRFKPTDANCAHSTALTQSRIILVSLNFPIGEVSLFQGGATEVVEQQTFGDGHQKCPRLGVSVPRVRQYLAQGIRQCYIALYGEPL